ncbi:hypothetical protein ACP70R_026788 [Stipagrostis hirtigluma subsp. patula]
MRMQVFSATALPLFATLQSTAERRAQPCRPIRARRRQHDSRIQIPANSSGTKVSLQAKHTRELEDRIRGKLLAAEAEPPPSSYDTAWAAMVPAQGAPHAPRFPRYVEWIMRNQHDDGSWGIGNLDYHSLGKEAINTTLACILALKKWNVGDEHVRKGLRFFANNSSYITDEKCDTPEGFNIIFPGMVMLGTDLGLEFPMGQSELDDIFQLREMELQSMASGRKAYMAYIAEGLRNKQDWDQILTYQSMNGSLFNSPSATSALVIHSRDTSALKYLDFLENKFGSSVPTVYPMNIYSKLFIVETLEKMGISYRFSDEINRILDMTYKSWLQNDEEILMDSETCAMAFRVLRMRGYDVSSDIFSKFFEDSKYHDLVQGHLKDTKTLLELYKASQARISEDERALENIGSLTVKRLKEQLCSKRLSRPAMLQESGICTSVAFLLCNRRTTRAQEEHRTFRPPKFSDEKVSIHVACQATEDIIALAIEEFCSSKALYQQELRCIESWVKEFRLDDLNFSRTVPLDVYVFLASTVFTWKFPEARIAWIKNCLLTTVVDDFFDNGGSIEELKNLIALIEKWDTYNEIGFRSEHVEILFFAVYKTNSLIGEKAAEVQNRRVIGHIAKLWLDYLRANMMEAEWSTTRYVPTMEEYMPIAEASIAMGPILATSLYLVGPEISENMISDPEYKDMLRLISICCRHLNDLRTYKRERTQGYVNGVLLHALRDGGSMSLASIEAAKKEIWSGIVVSRRELLRMVLRERSRIPRLFREIMWNMCKVSHLFYLQVYDFSSLKELMAPHVHEQKEI